MTNPVLWGLLLTVQADRQRIMDLLQITSIPPGLQGSNNPAT